MSINWIKYPLACMDTLGAGLHVMMEHDQRMHNFFLVCVME